MRKALWLISWYKRPLDKPMRKTARCHNRIGKLDDSEAECAVSLLTNNMHIDITCIDINSEMPQQHLKIGRDSMCCNLF
jgi:hypothetical protein